MQAQPSALARAKGTSGNVITIGAKKGVADMAMGANQIPTAGVPGKKGKATMLMDSESEHSIVERA